MKKRIYSLFCCLFITVISPANAAPPYQAIVLSVHDGDSLTALHNSHREKLRLANCDSPERAVPGKWSDQPGAWDATAALIRMVMGQTVTVHPVGESYNRIVANIHI